MLKYYEVLIDVTQRQKVLVVAESPNEAAEEVRNGCWVSTLSLEPEIVRDVILITETEGEE